MLEKITNPKELRKLSVEQLSALASEVRQRIISVVSNQGGHLASSLGAVDIAIVLHYCLNTPKDVIIWDVGHQAYAHKILTGRNKAFNTLRQLNGISGFPTANESAYDPFTTGHSSTSVSLALGMAVVRDLKKRYEKIVAVIGDGSLSGGMCFEALNHAGHIKSDLIVVLNTNEMSISAVVGALSIYMNKIISLPVYNRVRKAVDNFMKLRIPRIGHRLAHLALRFEEMLKGLIVPGIFFEELGFRYFGPFDGHNIELLTTNFKKILALNGPILFHIVTTKGKGYEPAEKHPERFHGASKFNIETGCSCKEITPEETYTSVFSKHIADRAKTNTKLIAITAAMSSGTGLDAFAQKFPQRFFDVGIAEQHAVGFAAGLAKGGYRPVVAIYSTFLQRSYDQVIEEVCLQNVPVVLCLDRAGLVPGDGPTHHGIFDIVYLRTLPNMVVMAPANKDEFIAMLDFAFAYRGPIALRYPKAAIEEIQYEVPDIALGKSQQITRGEDVALIALGSMVHVALLVQEELSRRGIAASVINARFAKPLDEDMILDAVSRHKIIATLEEGSIEGGFGSAVLECLQRNGASSKKISSIINFGVPTRFVTHGLRSELLQLCGLTPLHITQTLLDIYKQNHSQIVTQ